MPRPLIVFLVFSLCSANLYGQQAKAPSPAVKRILDKAVADIKKNRKEFDEANQKPLGDARVELQDLSTKLIKEGKTVDAAAVLKQIEMLDVDVMKMANAPAPVPGVGGGGVVPPQKSLLDRLAGKWRRAGNNDVITINADGSLQMSNGDQGRVVVTATEVAEVSLKSGWRLRFPMAQEQFACALEWDPQGQATPGFVLERIR